MCSKIGTNQRNPLACALARGNGIVPTFATTSVGAVPYLPQKSTKFTANRRTLGGVFTIRYSSSCNNSKGFQHMTHLMINSDDQCENKAKMNAKAHSRQQMKFRWSVWTLDGRCGHPSANQNSRNPDYLGASRLDSGCLGSTPVAPPPTPRLGI